MSVPSTRSRLASVRVVALTLLAGTAGLLSASAFVDSAQTHQPDTESLRDLLPVPGTASLERIAPDIAGGRPWGARVSAGAGGRTCLAVAPVVAGELQTLAQPGRRPDGPESCGDLSPGSSDWVLAQALAYDGRLVISGVAAAEITSLSMSTPTGRRELELSPRGAYLAVVPGAIDDLPGYPLTARLRSGRTLVYDWVSPPTRRN